MENEFTPLDPMGILGSAQKPAEQPAQQVASIEGAAPGLGQSSSSRMPADRAAPGLADAAGTPAQRETGPELSMREDGTQVQRWGDGRVQIKPPGGDWQDGKAPPAAPQTAQPPEVQTKPSPLRDGIVAAAKSLGVNPHDLATAISYETAGTFDPTKRGPTTQWGQHRGLIQFGQPQAQKYGVDWNDPLGSQLGENGAVVRYLRDAGVRPGMGLLDIYSAINAGGVGLYNRSDAKNGGAPGTVADKVNTQMDGHKQKASALLGGEFTPNPTRMSSAAGNATAGAVPVGGKRPMPTEQPEANSEKAVAEQTVAAATRQFKSRSSAATGLGGGGQRAQSRSPNAMGLDGAADDEVAAIDAQIASMQQQAYRDPRVAAQLAQLQQQRSNLSAMA